MARFGVRSPYFVRGIIKFPVQKGFGISDGRSLKDRFSETCLCWLGLAVPKGTHSNAFQTATPYSDFHLVLRTVFLDLSWNKQPLRGNVITG